MGKALTTNEKELIELLFKDNTPVSVIAKELGKHIQTVYKYLDKVGLRKIGGKNQEPKSEPNDTKEPSMTFDARRRFPTPNVTTSYGQKTTNVRRGDIFFVTKEVVAPGEFEAGRPAIIVSNERNNMTSDFVSIVPLTTKDKKPLPTHVTIHSSGTKSTALCEQITQVSKLRLREYCNSCTPSEMEEIGKSLCIALELNPEEAFALAEVSPEPSVVDEETNTGYQEVVFERDTYKRLYEELLDKLVRR